MDFSHIDVDPAICAGQPHIRGTRLTVDFLRALLAAGWKPADVLEIYPYLTAADLEACSQYSAQP